MSIAGMVLDFVLISLLVAALAYGFRLERRLKVLREGQVGFALAVNELNGAASRAESAVATLREASQETDLLHDRIVKARALKNELTTFIERAPVRPRPAPEAAPVAAAEPAPRPAPRPVPRPAPQPRRDGPTGMAAAAGPVLHALAANHAAQQSLNLARRKLDDDMFEPALKTA